MDMEDIPPSDNQDQQDDSELMQALGQEVRMYFYEQMAILLARIDSRMDAQQEILVAIRNLEAAMTTAMTAPKMLIQDTNGKPIGVRTLLS
jgi:membrane-bound lytic murein transglycosylase B